MADLNVRSDSVDVEQIMKQIRTRIREKRGSDYTEAELQRLASAKLEQFADPSGLRHDLLEQFRKRGDEPSTYHRHRGIRRLLLMAAHPLLKRVQKQLMSDLNLYFEIIHNLVVEVTKLGVENHNLKMKVESLSSRLDFDERRARSLESVVQYKPRPQGSDVRQGSGRPEHESRGGPRQDSDRPERESRGGPRQDSGRPERDPRNGGSGPRPDSGRPERDSRDGRGPDGRPAETRGPAGTGSGTPAATVVTGQASAPPQQTAAPSNAPSGPPSGTSPSGPSTGTGDAERRRRRRRRRRRPGSTLADSPNSNTPGGGGASAAGQSSADMADADDGGDDGDEGAGNQ